MTFVEGIERLFAAGHDDAWTGRPATPQALISAFREPSPASGQGGPRGTGGESPSGLLTVTTLSGPVKGAP